MADRTVSVRLQALVSGYVAGMRTAAKSTEDFVSKNRRELEHVGRGLLGIGAAAIGGLGLATKAAIDWESAWAGVQKTVDGSAAQMAVLEGELRDMAKSLPATHEEIAAVAEAAGQLGVSREDIADFTRTMVDLGETTNLTAEEAATSIAQLMNIMQTAPDEVDNLGAALVALGNAGASTERDIIQMAQRIAGAGAIVGLSEGEVLGLANALASAGIEVEAGGSAISRIMTDIAKAVSQGSEDLTGFARVAGMSADEFARRWESDPADALVTFIEGLGRMNAAGGDVFTTLDELGQSDIRVSRALLSMANAGDLLRESLELGNTAWTENTALTEEAQKRYQTAAAQISMAWNSVKDATIEVGSVIAPIVAGIAGTVGDLADAFGELPDGAKTAVAAGTALVGFASAAGGALLLFAPRIVETKQALEALGVTTGRSGRAIRGLGRVAGIAAGGLAALMIADQINSLFGQGEDDLRRYAERLEALAGPNVKDQIAAIKDEIEVLNEKTKDVADIDLGPLGHFYNTWDQEVIDAADKQDFLKERLKELEHQQELQEIQTGESSAATRDGAAAFTEQKTATEDAADALQAYQDELRAMTDPVFAVMNALDSVEDAQSAYNEAVKEHGKNSEEAERAAVGLAEATAAMEQAVLKGDLSWKDFDATLKRWVEQGVITKGQAEAIRESTDEAREAAEDYEGEYPAELRVERDKAKEREAQQKLDAIAAARQARVLPNLDGRRAGGVERDLNTLARDRFTTINVGYAVTGSGLPRGVTGGGAFGGLMTPAGIQRFPMGGSVSGPGGPRDDLVNARLSNGEFVVQAPAVARLGLDAMREINRGRLPQAAVQMPRELVVRDVNGQLIGRMRVEAAGVVHRSGREADLYGRAG